MIRVVLAILGLIDLTLGLFVLTRDAIVEYRGIALTLITIFSIVSYFIMDSVHVFSYHDKLKRLKAGVVALLQCGALVGSFKPEKEESFSYLHITGLFLVHLPLQVMQACQWLENSYFGPDPSLLQWVALGWSVLFVSTSLTLWEPTPSPLSSKWIVFGIFLTRICELTAKSLAIGLFSLLSDLGGFALPLILVLDWATSVVLYKWTAISVHKSCPRISIPIGILFLSTLARFDFIGPYGQGEGGFSFALNSNIYHLKGIFMMVLLLLLLFVPHWADMAEPVLGGTEELESRFGDDSSATILSIPLLTLVTTQLLVPIFDYLTFQALRSSLEQNEGSLIQRNGVQTEPWFDAKWTIMWVPNSLALVEFMETRYQYTRNPCSNWDPPWIKFSDYSSWLSRDTGLASKKGNLDFRQRQVTRLRCDFDSVRLSLTGKLQVAMGRTWVKEVNTIILDYCMSPKTLFGALLRSLSNTELQRCFDPERTWWSADKVLEMFERDHWRYE